jgi:hypothetical protein
MRVILKNLMRRNPVIGQVKLMPRCQTVQSRPSLSSVL